MRERLKTPTQLQTQVDRVTQLFGEPIAPPSLGDTILTMPASQIKRRFPLRNSIYAKALASDGTALPELREFKPRTHNDVTVRIRVLNSLDNYVQNHYASEHTQTLREPQMSVFEDLHAFTEQGHSEGYVKLPTGFGKTVLFSEFIEATDLKTLIVVPKKNLIKQTAEKLAQFAEDIDVGAFYGEEKTLGRKVTITTYDSLVNGLNNGTLQPDDFDLLILDEVHKALSDRRKTAIKSFNAIKLGFTATAEYSDKKKVADLLGVEIHNMPIREAVREGILSPLSVYAVPTEVDLSNLTIVSGEYNERELARAVNIHSRNLAAVNVYDNLFRDHSGIAYCVGVQHAKDLAEMFVSEKGITAEVIHGGQSAAEQQTILARHKSGETKILCNADSLIEGYDNPQTSVCLNLRPTLSKVVAEQRGGRVLRLDEENPNKHAYIVEFVDQSSKVRTRPVSFADIIEGAKITTHPSRAKNTAPTDVITDSTRGKLEIEGITVVTSPFEVMKLLRETAIDVRKNPFYKEMTFGNLCELMHLDQTYVFSYLFDNWEMLQKVRAGEAKGLTFSELPLPSEYVRAIVLEEIKTKLILSEEYPEGVSQLRERLLRVAGTALRVNAVQEHMGRLLQIEEQSQVSSTAREKTDIALRADFDEVSEAFYSFLKKFRIAGSERTINPRLRKLKSTFSNHNYDLNLDQQFLEELIAEKPELFISYFRRRQPIGSSNLLTELKEKREIKRRETEGLAERVTGRVFTDLRFPHNMIQIAQQTATDAKNLRTYSLNIDNTGKSLESVLGDVERLREDGILFSSADRAIYVIIGHMELINQFCRERLTSGMGKPNLGFRDAAEEEKAIAEISALRRQTGWEIGVVRRLEAITKQTYQEEPDLVKEFLEAGENYMSTAFFVYLQRELEATIEAQKRN